MKNFLIGIIIGIGKIMPGVSGAMLAIAFNVYENLLNAVANFCKNIKKNSVFLFPFIIGICFSIVFFSNIIKYCLEHFYLYTMALFIGLMIGAMYNYIKEIEIKFKLKNMIVLLLSFIFIFLLPIILKSNIKLNGSNNFLYLFFMGFLDAFATIVPGVSATALLLIFGSYNMIISCFANLLNVDSMITLFPFFIGFIFGIIVLTKIMSYLYSNKKDIITSSITGFSISSILLLIFEFAKKISININLLIILIVTIMGIKIGSILDG